MSKLYIVMPVINCLEMTKEAFEAVYSEVPWSFILIDQESNDGTEQWAHGMELALSPRANSHPSEFLYIKNSPRIPLAAAWNQGARKAFEDPECEYVAIVNNDVIFHPKTFDHLRKFMDKTGYLMVTGDNIKDRMSKEVMLQMELPEAFTDYDCQEITDWRAEGPDFSCFMVSRKFFEIIGYFDENFIGAYCEDQDAHVRIRRAFEHIKQFNDQGIDANRVHAKRLSTAPYYHYASQTMVRNIPLRTEISQRHGHNQNYYLKKWGAEHPEAMDGKGNIQPFGDARRNWKFWEGGEKYE